MGRHKILDGKLVSIGTKVTEEQMKDIDDLAEKLGMGSRSELYRAALARYIRYPPSKFGDNDDITVDSETDCGIRVDACLSFRELGISLNNALSRWNALDKCSRLDALVPCSNAECPKRRKSENN